MDEEYRVKVEGGGIRIDKYLALQMPSRSRSFLQKLLREGRVTLDGKPAKVNDLVQEGAEIICQIPKPKELELVPEKMPLDILYEDDAILVVNKPKGMVVHPAPGHEEGTLVNGLLYHCKGKLSGINGVARPGIVHRIDKDTTGSLVVCKTDQAHQGLAVQLGEHSIKRVYHAIVHGTFQETQGTIEASIGRHPTDRKKMSTLAKQGKRAVTHYRVLESFRGYTYLACRLQTGRTHQIRVHMASIHHPILGDTIYGSAKCPVHGLTGQTLHAKTIGFQHPVTGEYVEVDAPLPEYFSGLLEKLRAQRSL